MRIVTWNCRVGGFRYKAVHVATLRPDVLVVQECEPLDGILLIGGEEQPTLHHRLADPANPRRAIGVFSYSGMEVTPVDLDAPLYGFRRLTAGRGSADFNIVGIWTADTDVRATAYRQAVDGLRMHADWIRQRPTVMLGDFNDNASWARSFWPEVLELTAPLGLVSAYHAFFGESFGAENVTVGGYEEWRTVSDHRPVIVDVEPPEHS
jgi:hypothetical protein